jgi:hypothetical protein
MAAPKSRSDELERVKSAFLFAISAASFLVSLVVLIPLVIIALLLGVI